MFSADSIAGNKIIDNVRTRVHSGEPCYIAGLGISGHNAGAALIRVSSSGGIQLLSNDEEERFTGVKHYEDYPAMAISELHCRLKTLGIKPDQIAAWATSWDYVLNNAFTNQTIAEELPGSLALYKKGAFFGWDPLLRSREALLAPDRIGRQLGLESAPQLIMLPHHENHASLSYAASPFAKSKEPTMIAVVDGCGDRGSISLFQSVPNSTRIKELYCNESIPDSLGIFYTIITRVDIWEQLHGETRTDTPTHTTRRLREIFHFGPQGQIRLNRKLANWHKAGDLQPYTAALEAITGPPIPLERMWNPDAILKIESVQHSEITRHRVDLAAATQLVFEDGIFHIIDHLIRSTQSDQLVLGGGSALNGIANMKLLEHFNREWYRHNFGKDTHLKLWIPPTTGDAGVTMGAAYNLALRADALDEEPEVKSLRLGNVSNNTDRLKVADLMAFIISQDGVLGLFQGPAETGPRALGQRSILANPCNPETRSILNERVKFREAIRPLAPMVSRGEASRFFELAEGASADDYNAYRYMVLTTKARPEAYEKIPAVVHKDGTCRIQMVMPEIHPLVHDYLKAMGRRVGAENASRAGAMRAPVTEYPTRAWLGRIEQHEARAAWEYDVPLNINRLLPLTHARCCLPHPPPHPPTMLPPQSPSLGMSIVQIVSTACEYSRRTAKQWGERRRQGDDKRDQASCGRLKDRRDTRLADFRRAKGPGKLVTMQETHYNQLCETRKKGNPTSTTTSTIENLMPLHPFLLRSTHLPQPPTIPNPVYRELDTAAA
ncbi:Carbamoyltransferase-domain-containing protein [Favolaschia claudopus]|uniref:Carbamoyltransferase-domain-containing protein n=1 Tax=Favolaschia claudopus TaxID=2862362 RepID=A0AAW0A0M7_9AGAR